MESHSNNAEEGPSLPLAHMIVALCCLVVAGCLPAPGTDNSFYVTLPYAGSVVATVLCLLARLGVARRPGMDAPTIQVRAKKLSRRLPAAATFCLMTVVGEVAFLVINGMQGGFGYVAPGVSAMTSNSWLAAGCFATLVLAAAVLLFVCARSLPSGEG